MTSLQITDALIPDLTNRTAVITGGSNGIGLGTVEVLLAHNANVFILDLVDPPSHIANSPNVQYIRTDQTLWSDLVHAFACVTSHGAKPGIDIAIANAGVPEDGKYLPSCLTAAPTDPEGWRTLAEEAEGPGYDSRTIDVNLTGTMNFLMLAARVMKGQDTGGSIVVTTSATAYLPEHSIPLYCATKGALASLIRTLRSTFPRHNIAISGVAPSATYSATLPLHLAEPLVRARLPVSDGRHVGLAIVYSATAKQGSRVEDYGKDESVGSADWQERWNGRVIVTMGDAFVEVEERLIGTRGDWWGERNLELTKEQQKVTDFRA